MSNNDLENKLEAIKKLIEKINLSRCSPTPWSTRSYNCPIADTGDVYGCTDLLDNTGETILTTDRENDGDVEVDGWYQEVHLYTAAQAVNAIAEIQKMLDVKGVNDEQ
jgi:hypothetical protein